MGAVTASEAKRPSPHSDDAADEGPDTTTLTHISYAEFGQRFFRTAVTRERLEEAVGSLEGRPIEVGPISVGPISLVKVSASGRVGRPTLREREGEHVAFDLSVPLDLQMLIEVSFDKHRFDATVQIDLALTARAAEPLLIVVDVEAPTEENVTVDVRADGLRASVLQVIAGVDGELRRSVAKFVAKEIDKPEVRKQRIIDVTAALADLGRRDA